MTTRPRAPPTSLRAMRSQQILPLLGVLVALGVAGACGASDQTKHLRGDEGGAGGQGGAGEGGKLSVAGSQSTAAAAGMSGGAGEGGVAEQATGGVGGASAGGDGGQGGAPVDVPLDTTPPTISLGASSERVTSAGSLSLTATATDDVGVVEVVFYEDDAVLGTDASALYEKLLTLSVADNGVHHYRAVARDAAGNTAEAVLTVLVGIDAAAPRWQLQLNGVRNTSGVASLAARGLSVDSLGQPLVVVSSAQGDDAMLRYDLTAVPTLLYGTGSSIANAYLFGVAPIADDKVAVVGSTDGCGCSSIVHTQLLTGSSLGLTPHYYNLPSSAESEHGFAVAVDAAKNVYVAGSTRGSMSGQGDNPRTNPTPGTKYDAFLYQWTAAGQVGWVRQWGTDDEDTATEVTIDAGGRIWVAGTTAGGLGLNGQTPLGKLDAWVVAFDATGALLTTRQFGSVEDDNVASLAALPAGGVVVAGYGAGALAGPTATTTDTLGGVDGWLRFYDATFTATKTLPLGTAAEDALGGVAAGADGEVWVCGTTAGTLGAAPFGGKDAFVRGYVGDAPLFTRQIGTNTDDSGTGCAVDAAGNVFLLGETTGNLFATREGATDAFLLGLGLLGNFR